MFCSTVIIVATSTVNVKLYHTSVRLNWKQQKNNEKKREKKPLWYRRGQKQREMPYHFQNDHAQMLLHSALPSFYIICIHIFVWIVSYTLQIQHGIVSWNCRYILWSSYWPMAILKKIPHIFISIWSFLFYSPPNKVFYI